MKRFAEVLFLLVLSPLAATAAQVVQSGGTEAQAQQEPCLPEDEPCGGGGTSSVTVLPDDGVMTVVTNSVGDVAEFTVHNDYGSSYNYSLTCAAVSVGSCTAIKNAAGTTITSINLPGGGQAEVMVHFSAGATPGAGTVTLSATNGLWSDMGTYNVTVSAPPAPVAPTAQLHNHNRSGIDRGLCFTAGAGQAAGTSCGDLFITHGMPAYRTLGRDRSLTLLYNSAASRGQVLEAATITQPAGSATPTTLRAVLQVGGLRDSADYTPLSAGNTIQVVVGDRLGNTLATGVYVDTLRLRNIYPSVYETIVIDTVVVVNNRTSEYGRGWSLVGVERLLSGQPVGSQDLLWVGGDGSALRYLWNIATNTWVAPAADFRDTITVLYTGTDTARYVRTLRHKVRVVYDFVTGRHIQTINRYGQVTRFVYDTVSGVTRLSRVRVPGNDAAIREYRLFWSAAPVRLLDSIADPGGRKLRLTRSGTAVTAIADPDGQQTQFVYAGPDSLLSARKVPNPVVAGGWAQTTYSYAGRSKLARTRIQAGLTGTDSTVIRYVPWQVNGLDTLAAGLNAPTFPTPPLQGFASTVDGPLVGTSDRISVWVDRFGAATRTTVEGTGNTTTYLRDSVATPSLVTQIQMPGTRTVFLDYNGRGNLTKQRDFTWGPDSTAPIVTTWTYGNSTFPDSPTQVADGLGRHSDFKLHATFGVPDTITAPNGHVTVYGFYTSGLIQTVNESAVETWIQSSGAAQNTDQITSFEYDGLGQVKKTTTPSGAVTVLQSDVFGRVQFAWGSDSTRTSFAYDSLNRLRVQIMDSAPSVNPLGVASSCRSGEFTCAVGYLPWDTLAAPPSLTTRTYYGAVGIDSVTGPRNVPRGFRYDATGVPIQQYDEDASRSIRTFVGGTGLVDSTVARSGQVVRFGYDALGRRIWMAWGDRLNSFLGAWYPLVVTVPHDSIVYLYDQLGRDTLTKSIRLNQGWVSKRYWANGLVRSVTSYYSPASGTSYRDSLLYWYDGAGAVTRKAHRTMQNSTSILDTTFYTYGGTTGELTSMTWRFATPTVASQVVSFQWDALGRRKAVTYPSGLVIASAYDAAGTLRRIQPSGVSCTQNELCVTYAVDSADMRGRVLRATWNCAAHDSPGSICVDGFSRLSSNRYYRTGWLAVQRTTTRPDSLKYDVSGNIIGRYHYEQNRDHRLTYLPRTNRLAVDSGGTYQRYYCDLFGCGSHSVEDVAQYSYTPDGSRFLEHAVDSNQEHQWKDFHGNWHTSTVYLGDRFFTYDGLGRLAGIGYFKQIAQSGTAQYQFRRDPCDYDVEGRMVLACGSQLPVAYDGPNVSATAGNLWHFLQGPGIDDPILGVGLNDNGLTRVLNWVTDGAGRQLAVAPANGLWDTELQATGWAGWEQAGGVKDGSTFNASRSESSALAGLSYFRNRAYDQQTGQWTQEDPIGLAGGFNLYQYSGNNPVMFSDPWGLCPESMRDAEGNCPGGLSVDQWNKVEEAAIFHLSTGAQERVLGLLDAGKIHSGLGPVNRLAAWIQGVDPAASTNRLTGGISIASGTWDYEPGEIAFLLAHESEHTKQSVLKATEGSERAADAYACANTQPAERGGYANGGYPELGGCRN